jgi:hypothetical protein
MRIVTAAVVALAVSPAAADTAVSTTAACEVRFVRAPDDVRHVIERWLAAEPRCTGSIDLRVVPTDDGLYLLAQRPDGRLHERVVPDAQSAGVLVASWVADDWVTQPNVWSSPRPTSVPVAEPALAPPQDARPTVRVVSAPGRRGSHAPRWFSAGALLSTTDSDDGGLRLELDVIQRGNFTLGASLAWTETSMAVGTAYGYGDMRSDDVALTATGAYSLHAGRWELRTALGIGGVYSDVNGFIAPGPGQPWPEMPYFNGSGAGFIGTASMVLSARLADRWGIHAGLLAHAISERMPTNTNVDLQRQDAHLFFFTGLRRRI